MNSSNRCYMGITLVTGLFMMNAVQPVHGAMDASFELDPQSLGVSATPKKAVKPVASPHKRRVAKSYVTGAGETVVHTVKPGDNLFKILMRDYGLSNGEADNLIDAICRENGISDIKHLKIGQKIVIPALPRKRRGELAQTGLSDTSKFVAGRQMFRLESPNAALSELEASVQIHQTWGKLVPTPATDLKPVVFQSPAFSLTLDPQRYPVFPAMNNGRILLDRDSSIPPLVKALITEKDPSIRIVSESPRNGKKFLSAMLDSADFYSVEEDFSMDFGADPKLTIHSDFKIEKTPESLIKRDLVLMNAGQKPFPGVLNEFLKKEGFTLYEPFASSKSEPSVKAGQLRQVTSNKQSDVVDALLASISITPDRNRRLDVFAADQNGISLSVQAERYFERGGQRYVVATFDGDPITYTLYRILEAKGYHVSILEPKDDFRKVTEKLLTSMNIKGAYAQHALSLNKGDNYSLQMTGFKLENPEYPVAGVFLTNLELDHVIHDLLVDNGYSILTK